LTSVHWFGRGKFLTDVFVFFTNCRYSEILDYHEAEAITAEKQRQEQERLAQEQLEQQQHNML
jgi:hypothetical protein